MTAGMIITGAGILGIIGSAVLLAVTVRWFQGQRRRLLDELENSD